MNLLRRIEGWLSNPLSLAATLISLLPIVLVFFYVQTYRLSVPFDDEWDLNGDVAVATADGTLTLPRLIPVNGGHRTLFTNLVTAVLTVVDSWNLETQGWFTPLIVLVTLGLLLLLFNRTERGVAMLALVPFSLLLFSVYRRYNWWSVRQSHWSLVNTFVIAVLLVVCRERLTWRALLLALVLGWCATFTSAAGMAIWPMIVVVLWLLGNRNWRYYGLWIVSGLISIGLYLHDSGMLTGLPSNSVPTGDQVLQMRLPALRDMAEFMYKYIGNGVLADPNYAGTAMSVGVLALALYLAHVLILWRARGAFRALVIWTSLAVFSLLSGLFIGLGRVSIAGADRAFTVQYIATAGMFWLALVALILISLRRLSQLKTRVARWMIAADVVVAFALICLYVYSSANALGTDALMWGRGLTLTASTRLQPQERCVLAYPFSRQSNCLGLIVNHVPKDLIYLDEIAERRLTIFATVTPESLLPAVFTPDSKVLLATPDAWLNIHVRDLLLASASESQFFHLVVKADTLAATSGAMKPLVQVASDASTANVSAFDDWAITAPQLWLLETPEAHDLAAPYIASLTRQHYFEIYRRDYLPPDTPRAFTLVGYTRLPEAPKVLFKFGTQIALQAWEVVGGVDAQRCDGVTLQSVWSTDSAIARSSNMVAVLTGSDGVGVARAEGVPSSLRMTQWQPDWLNLDRRTISVPCDLAPGDYSLLVGLHDPDNGKALPAVSADGSPVGDLLYLTTIHVH